MLILYESRILVYSYIRLHAHWSLLKKIEWKKIDSKIKYNNIEASYILMLLPNLNNVRNQNIIENINNIFLKILV